MYIISKWKMRSVTLLRSETGAGENHKSSRDRSADIQYKPEHIAFLFQHFRTKVGALRLEVVVDLEQERCSAPDRSSGEMRSKVYESYRRKMKDSSNATVHQVFTFIV